MLDVELADVAGAQALKPGLRSGFALRLEHGLDVLPGRLETRAQHAQLPGLLRLKTLLELLEVLGLLLIAQPAQSCGSLRLVAVPELNGVLGLILLAQLAHKVREIFRLE